MDPKVLICLIGFVAGLLAPAVMLGICLAAYSRELRRRDETDDYVQ